MKCLHFSGKFTPRLIHVAPIKAVIKSELSGRAVPLKDVSFANRSRAMPGRAQGHETRGSAIRFATRDGAAQVDARCQPPAQRTEAWPGPRPTRPPPPSLLPSGQPQGPSPGLREESCQHRAARGRALSRHLFLLVKATRGHGGPSPGVVVVVGGVGGAAEGSGAARVRSRESHKSEQSRGQIEARTGEEPLKGSRSPSACQSSAAR